MALELGSSSEDSTKNYLCLLEGVKDVGKRGRLNDRTITMRERSRAAQEGAAGAGHTDELSGRGALELIARVAARILQQIRIAHSL
jgi:hypothetical protein